MIGSMEFCKHSYVKYVRIFTLEKDKCSRKWKNCVEESVIRSIFHPTPWSRVLPTSW
jgi:hypothetical protein